jgi:oxygen-independent coproporphyrinogen-3 oxidase
MLNQYAIKNNWEHYEISNLAKNKNYSKHNTSYWSGKPYLGIGPGAHEFDGLNKRSWNVADNWKYIDQLLLHNQVPQTEETLTLNDLKNEQIMTGLRTKNGIPISLFANLLDNPKHPIQDYLKKEWVHINNGYLSLNLNGWWQSDGIISNLFEIN